MNKEKYPAQALAIAMVVIVVASLIGISVYSRTAKDRTLSLDERASAEALQVSDLILNYLTKYPVSTIIQKASSLPATYTEKEGNGAITDLLKSIDPSSSSLQSLTLCPLSQASNEYYLNISIADSNTYFEILPGKIFVIPTKDYWTNLDTNCNAEIYVAVRGENNAAFSVTYVYGSNYTNHIAASYAPYAYEDVVNYCFSDNGSECNNKENLTGEWAIYKTNGLQVIPTDLRTTVTRNSVTYQLDEIRIAAIGGTVGVAYTLNESTKCPNAPKLVNIQAGANCDGTYRGKSVLVPERQWESPIFNYSIFNGEGTL